MLKLEKTLNRLVNWFEKVGQLTYHAAPCSLEAVKKDYSTSKRLLVPSVENLLVEAVVGLDKIRRALMARGDKTWSSRWTFTLAAAGSAIGLGNMWKFPYITGEYGGGAFVFLYLVCIALIGIPIMMSEILVGRHARKSPISALSSIARESGGSSRWGLIGWMGVFAGFCILSFYSVVAGWALDYTVKVGSGAFRGQTSDEIGAAFGALVGDGSAQILWHSLFMLLTGFVIARGVHKGLERTIDIMMPALFVLLILMLVYSMLFTGHFMDGFNYLFAFDFSKTIFAYENAMGEACVAGAVGCEQVFTVKPLLAAMGHAFFTLSLGMAAIVTYGAYMPKSNHIPTTAVTVAMMDTAIALIAGLVIFPIVIANGMEPGQGPGLLFVSLTSAFAEMPGGSFLGAMFFLMVSLAALSSAISLLEPAVAYVTERFKVSRVVATSTYCVLIWFVGCLCAYSLAGESFQLFGKSLFDALDFLTANILLPLGGMLIALFAGWVVKTNVAEAELEFRSKLMFIVFVWLARVVAPAAVFVVFVSSLYKALAA